MVVLNDSTQTGGYEQQKMQRQKIVEDGIQFWKEKQEIARQKKLKEQVEAKEMLEKFWPWGQQSKPRGLRNLRLEGLFPHTDHKKAERFVGVLDLGKPGCGAPMVNNYGHRLTKTRADPIIRFQGNGNLRRCVDNTLRYRTPRNEQEQYRKELDKLVAEKKLRNQLERQEQIEFERKQGWTNLETLKKLEDESCKYKETLRKEYDKFKNMKIITPNQIVKVDPVIYPQSTKSTAAEESKLTIIESTNGEELVPLLAKYRKKPLNKSLPSTDVTKNVNPEQLLKVKLEGPKYLQELSTQMEYKNKTLKETKVQEKENVMRHFSTLNKFWGRPGNGAPMPIIKKKQLNSLLYYPQMTPMIHAF